MPDVANVSRTMVREERLFVAGNCRRVLMYSTGYYEDVSEGLWLHTLTDFFMSWKLTVTKVSHPPAAAPAAILVATEGLLILGSASRIQCRMRECLNERISRSWRFDKKMGYNALPTTLQGRVSPYLLSQLWPERRMSAHDALNRSMHCQVSKILVQRDPGLSATELDRETFAFSNSIAAT